MPRTLNDIDYIKVEDSRTKTSKKPLLELGPLPLFKPLQIDDYYNLGEASIPSSINRHNPMVLFRLFFNNKIMDWMTI